MLHSPEPLHPSPNTDSIGLGAFCSPLISTQFSEQRHWSFHYLTSLGVAMINLVAQCAVLRFRTQEGRSQSLWACVLKPLTVSYDV